MLRQLGEADAREFVRLCGRVSAIVVRMAKGGEGR